MSYSAEQVDAIGKVLRQVLQEVSPEEIPLLKHLEEAPAKTLPDNRLDGILGFGIDADFALLLPILLEALKSLASAGAGELAKSWGKQLADWIASSHHDTIDAKALSKFGESVRARLEQQGFSALEAGRAADSVVSTMVSQPSLIIKLVRT